MVNLLLSPLAMKFDDLDSRMRIYETSHDLSVMPGIYIVVRTMVRTGLGGSFA